MPETAETERASSIRLGDRTVHRIGLGTNRVTDTPKVRAFLRRAMELGVDFVDTADVYTSGASEATIGEVFSRGAGDPLIATKGGLVRTAQGYEPDGRPEHLRQAVGASLHRLRRDRLDLYHLHRVDPRVPIEESLGVLKEFQDAGIVGQIGVSNVSVPELERALRVVRVVSVQNQYSVIDREHEDVLRYCEEHDLVFIPWSPFHRGEIAASAPLTKLAKNRGVAPQQIALAWLLQRSPVILPIPGTLSESHLEENLAAEDMRLDPDELRELDECAATRSSS